MEVIISQSFNVSQYQKKLDINSKWGGEIDGYSIIAHQNTEIESAFAVVDEKDKIICILVVEDLADNIIQIKNAWSCSVNGKGLRPKLINKILEKCKGLKIVTDVEMTVSSVLAYEKNRSSNCLDFKIYDMDNGSVNDYSKSIPVYYDPKDLLQGHMVANLGCPEVAKGQYVWIFGA